MATQSETGPTKFSEVADSDIEPGSGADDPIRVETQSDPEIGEAGTVVNYTTTITNYRTEPLEGLVLTDSLVGTYNHEPDWPEGPIGLGPNESRQFTRSMVLTADNAASTEGFVSTTSAELTGQTKEPQVFTAEHRLSIARTSTLTPSEIENLSALAGHAQLFIRPRFGGLEQRGDEPQRTVASFADMKLEKLSIADGVQNHLVTLGFRDLSRVLLGYTYNLGGPLDAQGLAAAGEKLLAQTEDNEWPDANFCAFGTWASLTIGRNVRNRFAPRRFDQSTTNAVRGVFNRLAIDVRQTNKQRLSNLLAAAQRVVFKELSVSVEGLLARTASLEAEIFEPAMRLLTSIDAGGEPKLGDHKALLDLYAKIEPALAAEVKANPLPLPPTDPNEPPFTPALAKTDRDERYSDLAHGLVSYLLARQATKAGMDKARSELIFRGNVLIESYVQIKVQRVLDYSVEEIAADYFDQQIGIEASENRGAGRWRRRINRAASERFERSFGDVWGRVLTDQVLVARVGEEVIRLGRDLPDPPGSTSFFPPALDPICDGWANNLLLRFDHSFGYGTGTRSHNWGVFDDRMNWLINLLRSRQQSGGVWKEPFTLQEEVLVRAHQDPTDGIPGVSTWTR